MIWKHYLKLSEIASYSSQTLPVLSVVPQGSILGPSAVFSLCKLPLCLYFEHVIRLQMFADEQQKLPLHKKYR